MAYTKLAGKLLKPAFKHGIRLLKKQKSQKLLLNKVTKNAPRKLIQKTNKGFKPIKESEKSWKWRGQKHYDANFGQRQPMKGFDYRTDDKGVLRRLTTSDKIPGTNRRNLTGVDVAGRAKTGKKRLGTEKAWKGELKEALDEFNMGDKYDEMVKIIETGNKKQDLSKKALNKVRMARGVKDEDLLTIEHIGALKNKWPNIPENRWGRITKRVNSRAGAKKDPPDINIRMQGTPKTMREWIIKRELGDADVTKNLPIPIKRKILAAIKKVKGKKVPDTDKIDDILEAYYKSIK